jgi:hypothetical protein
MLFMVRAIYISRYETMRLTVYEKMMEFLMEHHGGSFESFVSSILGAKAREGEGKNKRGVDVEMAAMIVRKSGLSKWKRARYVPGSEIAFA